MLAPKLEKKASLVVKCRAVNEEVFNVPRDVLVRTEKAEPLFVGPGPVSAVPV